MTGTFENPGLPIGVGLDFGTESVRVIFVDAAGTELATATAGYPHGQMTERLPDGTPLDDLFALQHPGDWLSSASAACREAIGSADVDLSRVVGLGVDFTSCTMLPTASDGIPLCQQEKFSSRPFAWPKLWKHHAAIEQTRKLNEVAHERNELFLARYGGIIGLEWFFPKMLETIEKDPMVAEATEVWIEAGDWLVWQLIGSASNHIPRSTCQAGYKALWASDSGYGSPGFFAAVDPRLAAAVKSKMDGVMLSPGQQAGRLTPKMANALGLPSGIAVSAATIDAHAGVPGVGEAGPGTLVMVMGTSSCHMINSPNRADIPGIAGVVDGGILPGLYGYETGQAAVGDAFAWLKNLLNLDSFESLAEAAEALPAGSDGVTCLDWMNGCRTPLMDGEVRGAMIGLSLQTSAAHLYRSMMEASACGVRWIVEVLRNGGVAMDRLVATGGLPHHNPMIVSVYSDMLQMPIEIHPSSQGPAVGAAVLGIYSAGEDNSGFRSLADAASSMAAVSEQNKMVVHPERRNAAVYDELYERYRRLARLTAGNEL